MVFGILQFLIFAAVSATVGSVIITVIQILTSPVATYSQAASLFCAGYGGASVCDTYIGIFRYIVASLVVTTLVSFTQFVMAIIIFCKHADLKNAATQQMGAANAAAAAATATAGAMNSGMSTVIIPGATQPGIMLTSYTATPGSTTVMVGGGGQASQFPGMGHIPTAQPAYGQQQPGYGQQQPVGYGGAYGGGYGGQPAVPAYGGGYGNQAYPPQPAGNPM